MCWRTVECIGESGVYIARIKEQIESVRRSVPQGRLRYRENAVWTIPYKIKNLADMAGMTGQLTALPTDLECNIVEACA